MSKSARVSRAAESHESQHSALWKDCSMAKYTTTVASRKALGQLLINAGGDAELWALIKPKE